MTYDVSNIFAKILRKEIPSTALFEDDTLLIIRDINPAADTHFLVIPKREWITVEDISEPDVLHHMFKMAEHVAKEEGLLGYKLLFNVKEDGGQLIPHVHLHVLSGEPHRFP